MSIRAFAVGRRGPSKKGRPETIVIVVLSVLVAVIIILSVRNIRSQDALAQWRRTLEAEAGHPPWPSWTPDLPPLPQPTSGRHRMPQDLHGAYAYVASHRELMSSILCFCGCRQQGHASAFNCFVEGLRADSTPIWTAHSFDCEMCVHIAREVMLMERRGLGADQIRRVIEKRYEGSTSAVLSERPYQPTGAL